MSRINPKDLNVGDRFCEHDSFAGTITAQVTEKPAGERGHGGRTAWKWKAINVETGKEIDYLLTEGFEHYGPRIYTETSVLLPRQFKGVKVK